MNASATRVGHWWAAGGVLLLAVAFRLYGLSGEMPPDSLVYAQHAWNLADGSFRLATDSWYAHRFPVFTPAAPLYSWFGVGAITTNTWPLVLSLGQIVFAMLVGWKLFGRGAGLLSGLLLAVYPLDVIEAGRLLPDMVMGGLVGWAGALWMLTTCVRPGGRKGVLLLAGICLALAVVVRPYALLLVVYLAADSWIRRVPGRSLLWVLAGMAAVAFPLLAVYQLETGDFLYRARVISQTYSSGVMAEDPQWLYYIAHIWSPKRLTGLLPVLLVGSAFFVLFRPDRVRGSLLLWIVLFVSFLQFGSMSLSEFVPILKRTRFLTAVSLPSAVLLGSVLAAMAGLTTARFWLYERAPRLLRPVRVALIIGGIIVFAASLWRIDLDRATKLPQVRGIEAVAAEVRQHPHTPILLDHWRSAIRLAYYLDFTEGSHYYEGADDATRMQQNRMPSGSRFGYLDWYPDASQIPEALVLLDDRVLASYRTSVSRGLTYRSGEIPDFAFQPPDYWDLILAHGGFRLYLVEPSGSSPPESSGRAP
jgi:4-amino-4-deoxy-L-arabinose transferase-like glycosyltransferase